MFTIFVTAFLLVDLVNGYARIINGVTTSISNHPHQVSLERSTGSHKCGGSIIAPQWVLTAAHCIGSVADKIALNNGNLGTKTSYAIDKIFSHPSYNSGSGAYPNDIALIKTKTAMNYGTYGHDEIALAGSSDTFVNQKCTITGWGKTETDNLSSVLKQTDGTILSGTSCANSWQSNYNDNVHICIDNRSTGACNGDSGGPMVCQGKLAGVTSWGMNGCDTTYPSVYARVSTYRDWIDTTIASN